MIYFRYYAIYGYLEEKVGNEKIILSEGHWMEILFHQEKNVS